MSVKQIGLSGLCWLLCGLCWLHAQAPSGGQGPDLMPQLTPFGAEAPSAYSPGTTAASSGPLASAFAPAPAGTTPEGIAIDEGNPQIPPLTPIPLGLPVSPYLTYPRSPCCCGNVGTCGGPLGYEMFIRSGWAFPIGQSVFSKYLDPGWDIEGGARLLLFNPSSTAAWTGTLSISNIFARTGDANLPIKLYHYPIKTSPPNTQNQAFPITEVVLWPELITTVSSLNMTFANVGFGREWWLCGSANPGVQGGCNWRIGCDGGGRWGSASVQFNEFITHHTGIVGGMYGALYSDVSWIFRAAIPFAGVRLEYNYIWSSLLQDQNNGNFSSLNLLLQLGVRF